jgi:hypothetical protein
MLVAKNKTFIGGYESKKIIFRGFGLLFECFLGSHGKCFVVEWKNAVKIQI